MRRFLAMLLCSSLLLGSRDVARAVDREFDVSLTGGVTISLLPEEIASDGLWQVVSGRDAEGRWVVDPTSWLRSGETLDDLPSGRHTVVIQPPAGWREPPPFTVVVAAGASVDRAVHLHELTIYSSVADIPHQEVRHGETLSFVIESGAVMTAFEPHREVERDIRVDGSTFRYRPTALEREQFVVTLRDGESEKDIVIQPLSRADAERTALEYGGDLPDPEAKTYLHVAVETSPAARSFNHETQTVRSVTISGPAVVFEEGHENDLFEQFSYTEASRVDDIEALTVYADTVAIRGPLHLPQTRVVIHARELRFEDGDSPPGTAYLATTPLEKTLASTGDGSDGLTAGDMTLHVARFSSDGFAERLILSGGSGQDPQAGRDGTNGRSMVAWSGGNGTGVCFRTRSCFAICSGWAYDENYPTEACPTSGTDAVAGKRPGNGGDAGTLAAPLDLSEITVSDGGAAGATHRTYRGGRAGTPRKATWQQKTAYVTHQSGWEVYHTCAETQHGKDAVSPGPTRGAGRSTTIEILADAEPAWLQTAALRGVLEYTRDAYLNGHTDVVRDWLEPYGALLSQEVVDGDPELTQIAQEIHTLLHRVESFLDYFGNPAGWVPMLSFEVTKQLFEDEVAAAGDLLYLAYYLNDARASAEQKASALVRVRAELSREIEAFEAELDITRGRMDNLIVKAEGIDRDIRWYGGALKNREEQLRSRAELNAGLKKAFRVAGKVLPLIPVGQPALGLAGAGFTGASRFNEQSALDSAIDGTNAAHVFLQSHMDESMDEFQTASGGQAGAAMVARQKALQGFDAGIVAISETLQEVRSWESDVEAELQLLAAEDPASRDLAREISALSARKMRFGEELAETTQMAKRLMNGITQNELALGSLNRDAVAVFGRIDQDAFRYIKEMERRAKDRLLKYQYYLAKAFEYRTVRAYVGSFQLGRVYEFLAESFTHDIRPQPGASILDARALAALYSEELRQITSDMVDHLIQEPPEQTVAIPYRLTPEELEQLNTPPFTLRLNPVKLGVFFSRTQENLRISELKVDSIAASPRGGANGANVSILFQHSGESLIRSKGETYRFVHYRTIETPPITWEAVYSPFSGSHTQSEPSAASNSLLGALLAETPSAHEDLLLYSRPSAAADIVITKETLSDAVDMVVDSLTLTLRFDFVRKQPGQADVEVNAVRETGQRLMTPILLETRDDNGRRDGRGSFERVFRNGELIAFHAPRRSGSHVFLRWEDRFGTELGAEPALDLVLPDTADNSATVSKVFAVYAQSSGEETGREPVFQRGDANSDSRLDLSDAITLLLGLFGGGSELRCEMAGDANDDGQVDISDPVALLAHLFSGAAAPPAPLDECGADPTPDALTCDSYGSCEG